ncbi:MAG: hypothetical protein J7K23_10220 [Thermoproteales archaeon]|nr:hypothetical protein [Thermoproteales archaeon]
MTTNQIHGNCINYSDGKCLLYNINVSPNAPACPNFQPKKNTTRVNYVPAFHSKFTGYTHCFRRRHRHRNGWKRKIGW